MFKSGAGRLAAGVTPASYRDCDEHFDFSSTAYLKYQSSKPRKIDVAKALHHVDAFIQTETADSGCRYF